MRKGCDPLKLKAPARGELGAFESGAHPGEGIRPEVVHRLRGGGAGGVRGGVRRCLSLRCCGGGLTSRAAPGSGRDPGVGLIKGASGWGAGRVCC